MKEMQLGLGLALAAMWWQMMLISTIKEKVNYMTIYTEMTSHDL